LGVEAYALALRRRQAKAAPEERDGLMLAIHPNARTTPAGPRRDRPLAEASASWPSATASPPRPSASGASAARPSAGTAPAVPQAALEGQRGGARRRLRAARATGFPLDDLTFVVAHFLPHLDRDNVYRILRPRA
jgi:hypothetical protein